MTDYTYSMEEYHSPGTVLHIHLLRNFLLVAAIIGPIVLYWTEESKNVQCWETAFGQDIYRIIIVDLIFSCMGVPFYYALRYLLHRQFPHKFTLPPFNISHACLKLVFNQTLTWLGMLYSPVLPLVLVIKMAIIFYIKVSRIFTICPMSWLVPMILILEIYAYKILQTSCKVMAV